MLKKWQLIITVILSTFFLDCSHAFYGAPQERSKFISAKLAGKDVIVFSFSHMVYRMAKGMAAFPDGGIPKYLKDIQILGTFHLKSGKLKILKKEKNTDWEHDQGHFSVMMVNEPMAVVSQSGQLRGPFQLATRYWLVNIETGSMEQVPFQEDLAGFGRALSEMYLINPDGTMLFVCPSIEEDKRQMFWRRDSSIIPEVWIRYPAGEYGKIAKTRHYERIEGDEVIYWISETRTFKAFNMKTRKTRVLPDYKYPPYQDTTIGVTISTHGEKIQFGNKVNGEWQYEDVPLIHDMLK